jgi:hypothetical protein
MRISARAVGLLSVVAMAAGACSGGSGGSAGSGQPTTSDASVESTQPASGDLISDGTVDVDALTALVAGFAALDPDAQRATVDELSGGFERELYGTFGLTDAIGGDAAARQSISETAAWFNDLAAAVGTLGPLEPDGFRAARPAQSNPTNIGEGLFGGLLVTTLGASASVSATSDGKEVAGDLGNDNPTRQPDPSDPKVHITFKDGTAELTSDATFTDSKGVTTTLKTTSAVTPCPNPDGSFQAKASIDTSSTVNNGATGKRGTFDVTIDGTVDDDAKLVGYDWSYRGQYADFTDRRGGFIDVSATFPQSGPASAQVNRSGGTVTDEIVTNATSLGAFVAAFVGHQLADVARTAWESGRCVELKPSVSAGPTGLATSASVTITAAPRSKVDGGAVGGKVTALLTGGESAVSPSSTPLPADAQFTYDAPSEVDKTGTVSLEARSRRGVAKATIDFDTKKSGYVASGGTEVTFSGTVPDLALPFELEGAGQGFTVSFSFTPTDASTGMLTYSGSGGGVTLNGTGTYTITGEDPDPLTLTYSAQGCVNVGGCRNTTNSITLTRSS